jgi:hypothetical protein
MSPCPLAISGGGWAHVSTYAGDCEPGGEHDAAWAETSNMVKSALAPPNSQTIGMIDGPAGRRCLRTYRWL